MNYYYLATWTLVGMFILLGIILFLAVRKEEKANKQKRIIFLQEFENIKIDLNKPFSKNDWPGLIQRINKVQREMNHWPEYAGVVGDLWLLFIENSK